MSEERQWYCMEVSGGPMGGDTTLLVMHTTEATATMQLWALNESTDMDCRIVYWRSPKRPYTIPEERVRRGRLGGQDHNLN